MKAIETVYNGNRYRSRLEARWAVFFESAGIEFHYEPEGFDIDGIRYLPDFYLPNVEDGLFVEVKGMFNRYNQEKVKALAKYNKILVVGNIPTQASCGMIDLHDEVKFITDKSYIGLFYSVVNPDDGVRGTDFYLVECPLCKKFFVALYGLTVVFKGGSDSCCQGMPKGKTVDFADLIYVEGNLNMKLVNAYRKARQKRFEFNEREEIY